MSRSHKNSTANGADSLSSIADWVPDGLLPAPLLYPIAPRLRRFYSPNAKHIDVTGDPPLCRACAYMLSQSYVLEEHGDTTTLNVTRLRRSAELGCYICAILFNAQWTPLGSWRKDIPAVRSFPDIVSGTTANGISFMMSRWREGLESACFYLEIFIKAKKSALGVEIPWGNEDLWRLGLQIIPETYVEEMNPQELPAATIPESIANLCLHWIENCQHSHQETCCIPDSATWHPTRLIHVRRAPASSCNLEAAYNFPTNLRYVTLSHCWGRLKIFKLLSTNLDSLMESLPMNLLTPLFRDAIDFTRRIGIEYIWIDSLCIIQDCQQDWARESIMMGEVYKNSWCNLSATGFSDGHAGLYVQRDPSVLYPRKFNLDVRDEKGNHVTESVSGDESSKHAQRKYYCMEDILYSDITLSPLAQRAWVYQERLLSQRILHFGSRQILWECKQLEACETFPNGVPGPLKKNFKAKTQISTNKNGNSLNGSSVDSVLQEVWSAVKRGYNDKDLTFSTDKVVAISGLAKEMQLLTNDSFIAGLWKKRFLQELLWCCPYSGRNEIIGRPRPEEYQAPSWSWLSINISITDYNLEGGNNIAHIIDYGLTHPSNSASEFGQITEGYVRIRSRLISASFAAKDKQLLQLRPERTTKNLLKLEFSSGPLILPFSLIPDIHEPHSTTSGWIHFPVRKALGRAFFLLPIARTKVNRVGLILKHTGVKGEYQRMGLWGQAMDTNDKESVINFEKCGSNLPLLREIDYEVLGQEGECTVKIS